MQIKKANTNLRIFKVADSIVGVQGTYPFKIYELVVFEDKNFGYVTKTDSEVTYISLLDGKAKVGQKIYPSGETFYINVDSKPFGNIYDANGTLIKAFLSEKNKELDLMTPQRFEKKMHVFAEPKTIYTRSLVNEPLQTGTIALDALIPIGKGQRELIVGDRATGKTAIALNMFLAQKDSNVKCIYVAIGKKKNEVLSIANIFRKHNVLDKSIIIVANAESYPGKKIIAPYVGMAIARYLRQTSQDVLIVFDDLSIHADAHRESSLLTGFSPGREAYPGDVFFMHSKLLEHAGKFDYKYGGGSITAIPIVETQDGDISGYIPTNVISITDGQIYTSRKLFNKGIIPAIDIAYSVSRVGTFAQTFGMIKATEGLRATFANYLEYQRSSVLGTNLIGSDYQESVHKGKILLELIKQGENEIVVYGVSVILIALLNGGYLNFYSHDLELLQLIKKVLLNFLTYDVLGKKVSKSLMYSRNDFKPKKYILDHDLLNKYLMHIILPLLKYHIHANVPGIRNNKHFVQMYANIRIDSRILLANRRKHYNVGVAYDYKL